MINVRPACREDLPAILELYNIGRAAMRANGNMVQWVNGYPGSTSAEADLAQNVLYVITRDGVPEAVFTLIIGEEPNYRVIEGGEWHSAGPYGTIHRMASSGRVRGMLQACVEFCKTKTGYIRIDTHADNRAMLGSIAKAGFRRCGTVYMGDGTPRIAFDLKF